MLISLAAYVAPNSVISVEGNGRLVIVHCGNRRT